MRGTRLDSKAEGGYNGVSISALFRGQGQGHLLSRLVQIEEWYVCVFLQHGFDIYLGHGIVRRDAFRFRFFPVYPEMSAFVLVRVESPKKTKVLWYPRRGTHPTWSVDTAALKH